MHILLGNCFKTFVAEQFIVYTCFIPPLQTYDPSVNYDSDSDSNLNNTKVHVNLSV